MGPRTDINGSATYKVRLNLARMAAPTMTPRNFKWLMAALLTLPALVGAALLFVIVFGWNWARAPLQDLALDKTGRALLIGGDLELHWAWPLPRISAANVSFANPPWALAPQMLAAEAVDVTLDLPALLQGRLAFPQVRLKQPRVFLEQASGGRKTWLLDRLQIDENRRIPIGQVLLDAGQITYIDTDHHTALHAALSTPGSGAAGSADVVFRAQGLYQGQPVLAHGSGGAVLAWRDDRTPYPMQVQATLGNTQVRAAGTVTSLHDWAAVDLALVLSGDNLASLFPLIGIALPPTPAYRSAGRLLRQGTRWRYESFTGQIGRSDISGTLQVDTAQARPLLTGALVSRRLDLADLGPAVGRPHPAPALAPGETVKPATPAPAAHVLPNLALDTTRWASLDADVTLKAQSLVHSQSLPLEQLQMRAVLKDRQLTLDPLDFGIAGGQLKAQVALDGRAAPLRGRAKAQLRGLKLAQLLPAAALGRTSVGLLGGELDLSGQGDSVGRMLATANGRVSLVAQRGEISRLLMEQTGLHLLEILSLNLTGDQTIALNCLVADFVVADGMMGARALVLDTAVNTLVGRGSINLAQETLDLTIVPHTKVASAVALRTPFNVKGSLREPRVQLDTARIALRGGSALLLGLLNPLLALVPLFEPGPGVGTDCAGLVRQAQAPQAAASAPLAVSAAATGRARLPLQ